ncbi:hypothetical protein SRL2020028_60930 [Mycobacterium kiyosense]|uniref:Uncharacterized protein n=1 Tax=Mycobacterium kiyosense TaxID=2871094 RepID=A0AA37V4R4_9MYCO|nr:hypothetical protein [Mycobacterium kiyosense]GLB86837.1 hypothetical protein SRL2020028_60930 [Mycobacterium kiyosense]
MTTEPHTTSTRRPLAPTGRRPLGPAARRAAARMVIAANKANGETPDPRIVAVAEGKD